MVSEKMMSLSTFIQTHIIKYGVLTYVYDRHIDPISSSHAFIGLIKVLSKLSESMDCSKLTIYLHQKRKNHIACKILDGERIHEASFKTTLDAFEKDSNELAEQVLKDMQKVTKMTKAHYFEVK